MSQSKTIQELQAHADEAWPAVRDAMDAISAEYARHKLRADELHRLKQQASDVWSDRLSLVHRATIRAEILSEGVSK